ncbi:hypothetical protein G9A89_006965 [Geosiphon pyriformis]|nr:hypothetical protein G9A89_006965 [Geosiphon pyriformis]
MVNATKYLLTSDQVIQYSGSISTADTFYTPYFQLNLGESPKTGTYHFLTTALTSAGDTCTFPTEEFTGIVNPNSSPSVCPT